MKVIEIPVAELREAPWNPNAMDPHMAYRLTASITRFGLVENLVVRSMPDGTKQVLSGNQRLQVIKDLEYEKAPCVIVELDDANAMLMAQALNQIQGEDDPGLRAELMRSVLTSLSEEDVLAILPESTDSLQELCSIGQGDMAIGLTAWNKAQSARLQHMTFQLTKSQRKVVEQALGRVPENSFTDTGNPNKRGLALFELCKTFLKEGNDE